MSLSNPVSLTRNTPKPPTALPPQSEEMYRAAAPVAPGYNQMPAPLTSQGMYGQQPKPGQQQQQPGAPQQYPGQPSLPTAPQPYAQTPGGIPQQPYGGAPQMGVQPGPSQPYQSPGGIPQPPRMPQQPQQSYGGAPQMQPVSLQKGGNMSLSKAAPGLQVVRVGLGWDVRQTSGAQFDLDASVFLCRADGKVRGPQDFIFYNNLKSPDGSIFHHGDNLTGAGEGDDEQITIDLMRVPPEIEKLVFAVSIYEADKRGQNFGMVQRAFIRVVRTDGPEQEIVRFDLTEEASMFNCMLFGEVYRYSGEWKFRAISQGFSGGLKQLGDMFGINLV